MSNEFETGNRFQVLCHDQVHRLHQVMARSIPIHGRGNFPTLDVNLKDFIRVVRDKLIADSVKIHDIRLNGGAASYVLGAGNDPESQVDRECNPEGCHADQHCPEPATSSSSSTSCTTTTTTAPSTSAGVDGQTCFAESDSQETEKDGKDDNFIYNDLDLIFGVDISGPGDFERIKQSVLKSLLDILPNDINKERMNTCSLKEAYVQKLFKIQNSGDRWSLISLANNFGRNVELKFVDCMKRKFEFSVDSFQIILDSLLAFYDVGPDQVMTNHFYPTVVGESVYGDISVALKHLRLRQIATRCPEQIRGGGLFKYCALLVRGYTVADEMNSKTLEKYMCSRFFIDFPDLVVQQNKLQQYLINHLSDLDLKYRYLLKLHHIIDESTVCLMNHERRQTLQVIQQFANQIVSEIEYKDYVKRFYEQKPEDEMPQDVIMYADKCNLIIDQVFYGVDYTMPPYMPAQIAL